MNIITLYCTFHCTPYITSYQIIHGTCGYYSSDSLYPAMLKYNSMMLYKVFIVLGICSIIDINHYHQI